MKILMTVFQMLDYGGIVQYTETLARGFTEQGHKVKVVLLRNSTRDPYMRQDDTTVQGNYKSVIANRASTLYGWYGIKVYSYGNKRQRRLWRSYAEKFDLVIHLIPVPEADRQGAWKKVYDIETPQLLISHDAHFPKRYPHMIDIADKVVGIVAVHIASLNSLEEFPAPRCLIGNPHVLLDWDSQKDWDDRRARFVSAHVWKPWKHMELVVQAIPHLHNTQNWLAGDGIEGRYMRSKDKCKPKYKGIWRRAEKAGMVYAGMCSPDKLMKRYLNSRVMVDMSFSNSFIEFGNHVNRSTLEAYNGGCVPLVVAENMHEIGVSAKDRLFFNGKTHLEVMCDVTPKELAQRIEEAVHMPAGRANKIIERGRELLATHWDYRVVAQQILDFSKLKKTGMYKEILRGKMTDNIVGKRNLYMSRIKRG